MYERLEITGLRGFSETGSLNLAQPNGQPGSGLTILVGPNNGGKSTVIEALRALAQDTPTSFTEGKRNKMAGDSVNLRLIFGERTRAMGTVASGGSETRWVSDNSGPQILTLPSRRYFGPYFGRGSFPRQQYIQQIGSLTERGQPINFSGRLFKILDDRQRFNAVLEKVLFPVPNWTIDQSDQGQYYLKFQTGNQFHNSDGLGEGIVSLFFIIDALYDSSAGALIALDEPELSLHPMLQRRLARLLAEFAKDRQVVYATHSPYFVNFEDVTNGGHVARVAKLQSGSRIFELKRSTAEKLSRFLADRNNPHVLGLDAREAFFLEDGIILVEGQEDVLMYPKILQQMNVTVQAEFFGWGVGGADNMKVIAALFKDLGFSKLIGLLDGNRNGLMESLRHDFPTYQFLQIPADDVRTKNAVGPKSEVKGLLDENGTLREEFRAPLSTLFGQANQYLNMIT